MGFRFLINLNPIQKVSRISSSYTRKNFINPTAALLALNPEFCGNSTGNPNFKIHKRWHIGHSHHQHHNQDVHSGKEGEKIFGLGLAADIGLATGKSLTGYLTGSTAIIADAAHSISDVVLSGVALWSFKAASVPKDKEHPYGHF